MKRHRLDKSSQPGSSCTAKCVDGRINDRDAGTGGSASTAPIDTDDGARCFVFSK